jgi:hypothetical protein
VRAGVDRGVRNGGDKKNALSIHEHVLSFLNIE